MRNHYACTGAAGIGAISLALLVAGCGGSNSLGAPPAGLTPTGTAHVIGASSDVSDVMTPDQFRHHRHHHGGYCATVTATQNFNGQAIGKGAWLLFTSVTQFQGNQGGARVEMEDSTIRFTTGLKNYKISGPDMELTYGTVNVRLRYTPPTRHEAGGWAMRAPLNTDGNDFIDDIAWRVPHALPGNLQNVTWSAKFYSKQYIQQMHWQWGAAEYTRMTSQLQKLGVKALDDQKYPPYNNDSAGTPERYKGWYNQQGGGTGGQHYTGVGGPNVNVTPCT